MRTMEFFRPFKKDIYFLINYQQRNGAKLTEEGRRIKVGQSHDTVSVCVCNWTRFSWQKCSTRFHTNKVDLQNHLLFIKNYQYFIEIFEAYNSFKCNKEVNATSSPECLQQHIWDNEIYTFWKQNTLFSKSVK